MKGFGVKLADTMQSLEEKEEYTINFDTAWSCPAGILEKYSKMCKNGELDWMYYDEDYDGHVFITKENDELLVRREYLGYDYDGSIEI